MDENILHCGKYLIRQGRDETLIIHDPDEDIQFVIRQANIGAFMWAGLTLLKEDPPPVI